jgi:hypothetical protein
MILNKFREIQLCVFAKMLSLCWLNYIYFGNFYILSHNKNVHDYKTQFTHKEIYGRLNIYIQKTIKTQIQMYRNIQSPHVQSIFFLIPLLFFISSIETNLIVSQCNIK